MLFVGKFELQAELLTLGHRSLLPLYIRMEQGIGGKQLFLLLIS